MEQLLLFIPILFILIGVIVGSRLDKKIESTIPKPEEPKKVCPMHDWHWEEQIGLEDTWFIRCKRCRRLPGWGDEKV